jgi:DNA-binding CsgD family transcriptional regulator
MEHLVILIYTIAFAASASAISLTYSLSRRRDQRFFRDFLRYLALLGVSVAVNLAATYVENLAGDHGPRGSSAVAAVLVDLMGMVCVGGIVYWLTAAMYGMILHRPPRIVRTAVLSLLILGFVATTSVALVPPSWYTGSLHDVQRTINFLLFVVAAAAISRVTYLSFKDDARHPGTVRLCAGLHLTGVTALLVGFYLPVRGAVPLLAAVFLGLNLLPLFLIRRLHQHLYFQAVVTSPDDEGLAAFAQTYGISSREAEIIAQVMTGRTTAEIADRLFISASTVKNHLHNIYKKCKVRNRVELAMLVSESDDD